ncbi:MAG: hypothetical protein L3J54_12220, partial [Draconibacterium sp.]|nr:hypothetical protein [Draconibacterium sp.]
MSEEIKNLVFFQNTIVFLSIGSGVFVFLFFLFQKQSEKFLKLKWFVLFFVFSGFFIDLLLYFYSAQNKSEYFEPLYNIYSFSVALCFLLIFRQLPLYSNFKSFTTVVFGVFILIFCTISFYTRGI